MAGRSPIADGFSLVGSYWRENFSPFAVATVGSLAYAAGSVGSAYALGYVTDQALVPLYDGATTAHWAAVSLLIAIMALRLTGVIVRRYFAGMAAARARASLQHDLSERFVSVSLDQLRRRPPGELLAGIDADTEAAIGVIHPAPFAIGAIAMIVFAVASLAALDLPLMLATVGFLPLVMATSWASAVMLETPTDRERTANAEVTAATSEIIAGTQVIKTLGREDAELARFAEIVDHHRRRRVHIGLLRLGINQIFSLLPQLAMILIIVVGTNRVESGALEPGGLVQAVALFGVLAFPMQVIGFFLTALPLSVVGRRRVDRIRRQPDDPLRSPTAATVTLRPGPLGAHLANVTVGEADQPRLANLTLDIRAGETLALVGPTAAGKSTLIEVLARLRRVEHGVISYNGINSLTVDEESLRSQLTIAAQTAVLFSGTIRDNVAYGRALSPAQIEAALTTAGAGAMMTELPDGFDTVVGERGVALSGGQRQRVALARAIAGAPGLLLLDDATSSIDPSLEEEIIAALVALPTTVVMVTHRVAAMIAADRVALVANGQVTQTGTHEGLLKEPGYRELVEAYQAQATR